MPVLPAEARLLILAIRVPGPEANRLLSSLVHLPLNWLLVGAMAEREKLMPVLWNRLRALAANIAPDVAERIHAQAAVTEFRMAMTETTLQEVVERLAAEGIQVLLLKGAALATTVYHSFPARPMGDLDVLVRPEQARRAWQCLVAQGWQAEFAGGERFYEGHHHLVGLVDPKGLHIVLEIHRAMLPLAGPFLLDEESVWREASHVRLGTTDVSVPSDHHQLLHLCVHFAWSNMLFVGLGRTARDVAVLLESGGLDWDRFLALVRSTKADTCAYWTLAMARTLAAAPVPDRVLDVLRPRGPMMLTRALERAHIASALMGACPSTSLMRLLWTAAIRPGASGHGKARPWQAGEAFSEVFRVGQKAGRATRIRAHLRGWAVWMRFAGILGIPRPIV